MSTNTVANKAAARDALPFTLRAKVRLYSGADVGVVTDIVASEAGPQVIVQWPARKTIHDARALERLIVACGYCGAPVTEGAFCDRRCSRLFAAEERALDVHR